MTTKTKLPPLKPYIETRTDPEIGEYVVRADIVDNQGRLYGSANKGKAHTIGREEELCRAFAAGVEAVAKLDALCKAIRDLAAESDGVEGLHLNGDLAAWDDLLDGGNNSPWLGDALDEAEDLVGKLRDGGED